ncbi:MAG: hypothetical protein LBV50_09740 [Novosphingobium sp.]|jgi:hypothetical protein|nr:hypothetical protein [Novosphingobium sp.]
MDAVTTPISQTERLVAMVDEENPFALGYDEIRDAQLEAVNERFQSRVRQIKLLQNRAEEGGVSEVARMEDIVPLLFAHTAYKSYPENWLMESRWDRLGKWLDTVSTRRVEPMDTGGVAGLDDWLHLLEKHGHFVSCSSGTTGKCAMMNATQADLDFAGKALLRQIIWAGLNPQQDRLIISCGQTAHTPRNTATGAPMYAALADPTIPPFRPDAPPITIGSITEMVVLRKKIADGTARPEDIAYFEEQAARRERQIESVAEQACEAAIANRHHKLHIMGLFGPMYKVAAMLRDRGYSGKDFQENTTFISGGLKRVQVPDDYQDIIFDTFNIKPEGICHSYGMQEISTTAPRCTHGRYHMAPWVMLLLLDESGENLIPIPASGEIEGRAAFFDLSMDGRWGGVISGDKIRATWEPCGCGNRSPSIDADIQRYADMASGDKIACSGTIDAYVRGVT